MIRRILNRYRFTLSERKSLILLCVLLVFINCLRFAITAEEETLSSHFDLHETKLHPLSDVIGQGKVPEKEAEIIQIRRAQPKTIDINKADSTDFLGLYGIGPVFAGRIVKYRNLLGGYCSCEQLLEVYGMDTVRYRGFCNDIHVDTAGMVKLNINTAGFRELLRHPYLDYENVKLLVQYRDRSGPISSPYELWRDSVFNEDLSLKLMPYLKCR